MLNWLRHFELERVSFLFGVIIATIFWWVFTKAKIIFPPIKIFIKNQLKSFRQNQISGVYLAVKTEALQRAQSNHLANILFSLDEIIIEPKLIVQPMIDNEEDHSFFDSEIANLVPYTPENPFLSRNYGVPKITILQSLQKNANIVITGLSGMGKSVTLAHLVSSIARDLPECGELIGKAPLYFHILDTDILQNPKQSLFDACYKALVNKIPVSVVPRLAKFIQTEVSDNNAILIIDGIDELPQNEFDIAVNFIEDIHNNFPNIQIILSATPFYLGKLLHLNFIPLTLAAWSNMDISIYYDKWSRYWYEQVLQNNSEAKYFINQRLLSNWISVNLKPLTALEYTLFIWGALSGNLRGDSTLSIYESFYTRILGTKYSPDNLATFGDAFIEKQSHYIKPSDLKNEILNPLISIGAIRENHNGTVSFNHPDLLGFIASLAQIISSPVKGIDEILRWSLSYSYWGFRVSREANNSWLEELILEEKPPLQAHLLAISFWLRHAQQKLPWRNSLIKKLIQFIQNKRLPFSIRVRYITAFMMANDPSTTLFIRQMMSQPDNALKIISALAIGVGAPDPSLIGDLVNACDQKDAQIQKYSMIGLSTYNDDVALHTIARLLLQAEETVRQLAAEVLANIPPQGEEILKDAITMDDILVRRSAIFGLVKLPELWAFEILQKLSVEDSQWVVRIAAAQALEFLDQKNVFSPQKILPYFDNQWLIKFAGQENIGISPLDSPIPVLLKALNNGAENDRCKAIEFLQRMPNESVITAIYQQYYGNTNISAEIFNGLWNIWATGEILPATIQYGLN
ncbi:MAG: hypothetical protein CVU39_02785 [Chloroflexi bacterium HGW-Chloroflexi-10]|nr:MAG: hypothetical protein CVU39_02785 [Chloroflexi bacterium HGW-Chloroflexi-10]